MGNKNKIRKTKITDAFSRVLNRRHEFSIDATNLKKSVRFRVMDRRNELSENWILYYTRGIEFENSEKKMTRRKQGKKTISAWNYL